VSGRGDPRNKNNLKRDQVPIKMSEFWGAHTRTKRGKTQARVPSANKMAKVEKKSIEKKKKDEGRERQSVTHFARCLAKNGL